MVRGGRPAIAGSIERTRCCRLRFLSWIDCPSVATAWQDRQSSQGLPVTSTLRPPAAIEDGKSRSGRKWNTGQKIGAVADLPAGSGMKELKFPLKPVDDRLRVLDLPLLAIATRKTRASSCATRDIFRKARKTTSVTDRAGRDSAQATAPRNRPIPCRPRGGR